jgi:hypothetical protein
VPSTPLSTAAMRSAGSGHPDSRIEAHPAENRGSDQDTSEDLLIRRLLNVIMTDPTRRIAGSLADSIRQYVSADYAPRRGSFLRDRRMHHGRILDERPVHVRCLTVSHSDTPRLLCPVRSLADPVFGGPACLSQSTAQAWRGERPRSGHSSASGLTGDAVDLASGWTGADPAVRRPRALAAAQIGSP